MRLPIKYLVIVLTLGLSAWIGHGMLPADHSHNLTDYAAAVGAHVFHAPAAEAAPLAAQYEGVEVCTDHNPTVWHPLVKRDAAGAIICTYTHEHHDNPNTVNDLFGAPAAWYGGTQEISYPWQTSGSLGLENDAKHQGYKWFVERDLPCTPLVTTPPDNGCITAYRAQAHSRGDISDQTTRFHSFSLEAIVKYGSTVGMVRHGGHINTGFLGVMHTGGATPADNIICPPLATNPPTFVCGGSGAHRESSSHNAVSPLQNHRLNNPTWYAQHLVTSLSISIEAFGPIDANDPLKQYYSQPTVSATFENQAIGPNTFNNSSGRTGVLFSPNTEPFLAIDDANRLIASADLWTDHLGAVTTSCSSPSASCVPLKLTNVMTRGYGLGGQSVPIRDHDVKNPTTNKRQISYPN